MAYKIAMTQARWDYTNKYVNDLFGAEDEALKQAAARQSDAGLPPIAVTAEVGRLLKILTSMTQARVGVEVGTLAGYSSIWLARGLKVPHPPHLLTSAA
jgi:predicted O-methyltransferase YrrM